MQGLRWSKAEAPAQVFSMQASRSLHTSPSKAVPVRGMRRSIRGHQWPGKVLLS
jgi:hypothetical protein